ESPRMQMCRSSSINAGLGETSIWISLRRAEMVAVTMPGSPGENLTAQIGRGIIIAGPDHVALVELPPTNFAVVGVPVADRKHTP
ncbi:MAG TPA: hypothetical protein VEF54_02710, partial [archaeon]|nr:hypothetical protein [archaeon]